MKISVIVPIYNTANSLNRCIESLISQTYDNIEIILVDDGSSDNSLEICNVYARKDSRIKVFSQENGGPSKARNTGLNNASGEWILFVDSDDAVADSICQKLYDKAIETNADMVICNLTNLINDSRMDCVPFVGKERIFENKEIKNLEKFLITRKSETGHSLLNVTGPTSKLINRNVIKENRFPLDMDLAEDACFLMSIFKNISKAIYIDDVLYYRFVRSESLSSVYDIKYAKRVSQYTNWVKKYYENAEEMRQAVIILELKNLIWVVSRYMKNIKDITYSERVDFIKKYLFETKFDVGFKELYEANLTTIQTVIILLIKLRLYKIINILYTYKYG